MSDKIKAAAALSEQLTKSIAIRALLPANFQGRFTLKRSGQMLPNSRKYGVIEATIKNDDGETHALTKDQLLILEPGAVIHPQYRGSKNET